MAQVFTCESSLNEKVSWQQQIQNLQNHQIQILAKVPVVSKTMISGRALKPNEKEFLLIEKSQLVPYRYFQALSESVLSSVHLDSTEQVLLRFKKVFKGHAILMDSVGHEIWIPIHQFDELQFQMVRAFKLESKTLNEVTLVSNRFESEKFQEKSGPGGRTHDLVFRSSQGPVVLSRLKETTTRMQASGSEVEILTVDEVWTNHNVYESQLSIVLFSLLLQTRPKVKVVKFELDQTNLSVFIKTIAAYFDSSSLSLNQNISTYDLIDRISDRFNRLTTKDRKAVIETAIETTPAFKKYRKFGFDKVSFEVGDLHKSILIRLSKD